MMKSVVLILLVAVVAGISANPTPPNTNCCFADQFELEADDMVGVVDSGKGVAIGQSLKMAFDYTNKRLGALVTTSAGTFVYDYRMIIDFNKGVELFIDDKSKTCQKMPFNSTEMVHCIPAKAKLLDTFYMGNNEITANSFAYQYTEGPSTGELTMAVTKTDCIPLSSSFVGETAGTALMVGAGFKNYAAGIKDPATYFTVPSYCPQTVSSKPGAYYKHLLFQ